MNKILHGDSLDLLKDMDDNSVDSVVTDPPYGYSFMGKDWDKALPSIDIWKECVRVLKPGGSMYAMFYNKNSLLYYHSIMYLRGVVEGEFEKGLTEEDLMSKYSEAKFGCPYTKIYTEDEVKELCKLTGFRQIETHIDAPHIDTLETRKVEISNLPKNMGWHITVKAMK